MNQINQYLYVEIRIRKIKVTFNHKKTHYLTHQGNLYFGI